MASKILFYTNSLFSFGGVQRVLAVVAKALSQNYDITILTLDESTTKDLSMYELTHANLTIDFLQYSSLSRLEWIKCKIISAAYKLLLPKTRKTAEWYAKSSFAASHRKQLITYINQRQFDIVVGVHVFLSLHIASIKNEISAKTISWLHNSYEALFEKNMPYVPKVLHSFCQHQLRKLDCIIVLSDSDKKHFAEKMHLSTIRIYNPLTIETKGQADYCSKRFLSIGRMENGHKGFDILIKAFAEFAKNNTEWNLDIVGNGPERDELQKLINQLELQQRITIHPFTNHVEKYYTTTCVYILASRWEGFGLVLIEAMAYGHNIIASELPVTKELLSNYDFQSRFPVGDISMLTSLLHLYSADKTLYNKGEKAKTYVSNRFDIEHIIPQWHQLIHNLSSQKL